MSTKNSSKSNERATISNGKLGRITCECKYCIECKTQGVYSYSSFCMPLIEWTLTNEKLDYSQASILLGKERYGPNRGMFNLIGGKGESVDKGCLVNVLRREVYEESKLVITDELFERCFIAKSGKVRIAVDGGTVIFIGIFRRVDINVNSLNEKISLDNVDIDKRFNETEISEVKWIKMIDGSGPHTDKWIYTAFSRIVMMLVFYRNRLMQLEMTSTKLLIS